MFLDNSFIEQASQNVITPIALAAVAVNTIPAAVSVSGLALPLLYMLFSEPILWFLRRRRLKWGRVYDAASKKPVDLAVVRLYKRQGTENKLVQTKVTDKNGRYILNVKSPGKYFMEVEKKDYTFPTKLVKGNEDSKFFDLYHGKEIDVKEKDTIISNDIPLDSKEKKAVSVKELIKKQSEKSLRVLVAYSGLILAVVTVLIWPTRITVIALLIHILLFKIFRRLVVPKKPKSWGRVIDKKSKKPISKAVVRLFDMQFNRLIAVELTDAYGRYSFLVGRNKYQVLAEKSGYKKEHIENIDLEKRDEIIGLDISLEKGSSNGNNK